MNKIFLLSSLFCLSFSLFAADVSTNPTILFVGDSHSFGKMGSVVEKNLALVSDHVIMESSCGSTPKSWLGLSGFEKTVCGFWKKDGPDEIRSTNHQVPKFSLELEKYHPQVVVIQLGTNMAVSSRPLKYSASIVQMMNETTASGALCLWIGPPDAQSKIVTRQNLKMTNLLLIELAKKNNCRFIDSLKLTKFPTGNSEGIHYPPKLSASWGEKISTAILTILKSEGL